LGHLSLNPAGTGLLSNKLNALPTNTICSISPYFFNAGLLCSGHILSTVASAYAWTINEALASSTFPQFDVLFGPAYKGIPLAAVTSLTLWTQHKVSVGLAYDRKEVKDHGEGGKLVGSGMKGKKVLILDDVMTSGKAIRGAIECVLQGGGEVVGVIQLLDREEIGQGEVSGKSTVEEIEKLLGGESRVLSVLKMRDLMEWLEDKDTLKDELDKMREYRDRYGIKSLVCLKR